VKDRPFAADADVARPPTAASDEEGAAWPVLARIPWIDDRTTALSSRTAAYGNGNPQQSANASRDLGGQRTRVDRGSNVRPGGAHSYNWPTAAPPTTASDQQLPARYVRVDGAASESNEPSTPAPHIAAFLPERITFAARLFQWHAALAPYTGLITAASLLIAVGVVYSFTASPRPATQPSTTATSPLWPEAAPTPLTLNQPESPISAADDLSAFSWSAKLLPKPVPARLEESPATPLAGETQSAPPKALDAKEVPSETKPNETTAKTEFPPVAPAPKTAQVEPITPTPNAGAYPSTPFSAFDYESLRMTLDPANMTASPAVGSVAPAPSSR
jgi:hypothetical protein